MFKAKVPILFSEALYKVVPPMLTSACFMAFTPGWFLPVIVVSVLFRKKLTDIAFVCPTSYNNSHQNIHLANNLIFFMFLFKRYHSLIVLVHGGKNSMRNNKCTYFIGITLNLCLITSLKIASYYR